MKTWHRVGFVFIITGCTWMILNQDNSNLSTFYYIIYLVGLILIMPD